MLYFLSRMSREDEDKKGEEMLNCGLIVISRPSDPSPSSRPSRPFYYTLPPFSLLSHSYLPQIAKQMKKVHKEISQVSNGQEDQIAKVNLMQRKYLEMVGSNRNGLIYL